MVKLDSNWNSECLYIPEDVATTSGLDPFLAAKSWKLIGGAEALRGLLE